MDFYNYLITEAERTVDYSNEDRAYIKYYSGKLRNAKSKEEERDIRKEIEGSKKISDKVKEVFAGEGVGYRYKQPDYLTSYDNPENSENRTKNIAKSLNEVKGSIEVNNKGKRYFYKAKKIGDGLYFLKSVFKTNEESEKASKLIVFISTANDEWSHFFSISFDTGDFNSYNNETPIKVREELRLFLMFYLNERNSDKIKYSDLIKSELIELTEATGKVTNRYTGLFENGIINKLAQFGAGDVIGDLANYKGNEITKEELSKKSGMGEVLSNWYDDATKHFSVSEIFKSSDYDPGTPTSGDVSFLSYKYVIGLIKKSKRIEDDDKARILKTLEDAYGKYVKNKKEFTSGLGKRVLEFISRNYEEIENKKITADDVAKEFHDESAKSIFKSFIDNYIPAVDEWENGMKDYAICLLSSLSTSAKQNGKTEVLKAHEIPEDKSNEDASERKSVEKEDALKDLIIMCIEDITHTGKLFNEYPDVLQAIKSGNITRPIQKKIKNAVVDTVQNLWNTESKEDVQKEIAGESVQIDDTENEYETVHAKSEPYRITYGYIKPEDILSVYIDIMHHDNNKSEGDGQILSDDANKVLSGHSSIDDVIQYLAFGNINTIDQKSNNMLYSKLIALGNDGDHDWFSMANSATNIFDAVRNIMSGKTENK